MKTALKENGYPIHFIQRIAKQARVTRNNKPRMILQKCSSNTVCEKPVRNIKRILHRLDIKTAFRLYRTLRNILFHPKDRLPPIKKREVVYQITCKTCTNGLYRHIYGQTLGHRLKEHQQGWGADCSWLWGAELDGVLSVWSKAV